MSDRRDDEALAGFTAALARRRAAVLPLPGHQVDFLPGGPELVVTFEPVLVGPPQPDMTRPVWGQAMLRRRGFSVLGVKREVSSWYRSVPLHRLFRTLQAEGWFAGFERVVFYGASMGGYAALAFAACAPGCTVVALSPVSTLEPSLAWFDQRFAGAGATAWLGDFVDGVDGARAAARVFVSYDPYQVKDLLHVQRLPVHNLVRLRLPFAGHATAQALKAMGLLEAVFDGALDGSLDERACRELARQRAGWAGYHMRLGERGRHAPRRLRCVARALELDPANRPALALRRLLEPAPAEPAPRWPAGLVASEWVPLVYLDIPQSASTTVQNHLFYQAQGRPPERPDRIDRDPALRRSRNDDEATHRLFGHLIGSGRGLTFTFVRNPAARAYACFCDKIMRTHRRDFDAIRAVLELDWGLVRPAGEEAPDLALQQANFERFLAFVEANLAGNTPVRRDAHWRPQAALLKVYRKQLRVDFVGRVESFEADFAEVLHRAEVRRAVDLRQRPWRHPAPPFGLAEVMTPALQQRVNTLYAADYAEFGYRDGP